MLCLVTTVVMLKIQNFVAACFIVPLLTLMMPHVVRSDVFNEFSYSRIDVQHGSSGDFDTWRIIFRDAEPRSDSTETNKLQFGFDVQRSTTQFVTLRIRGNFFVPKDIAGKNDQEAFNLNFKSVESTKYRQLFNTLRIEEQVQLIAGCRHVATNLTVLIAKSNEIENADTILNVLRSSEGQSSAQRLLNLCTEYAERIYVKDLQRHLNQAGFDLGTADGIWGNKSQQALSLYLTQKGSADPQSISSSEFLLLRRELGTEAPKLTEYKNDVAFFDGQKDQINESDKLTDTVLVAKLSKRKTINPFRAWHLNEGVRGYGLYWSSSTWPSETAITLTTPFWNYYFPDKSYDYPGVDKFLLNVVWGHDAEYGKTVPLRITAKEFPGWFSSFAKSQVDIQNADGVLLDWWHNNHESSNGYPAKDVKKARERLARELRAKLGPEKIIMGNVNWYKDRATLPYLNGAWFELYKTPYFESANRVYDADELYEISELIEYYEENLQFPKLIAIEGWRKTKAVNDEDRNTSENRRVAKILTAMSAVIPTNGYILYGDNNNDTPDGDHGHILYDFYNFDIGIPTSGRIKLSQRVSLKYFDRGFIAFNISDVDAVITLRNGNDFTVPSMSAKFCEQSEAKLNCLSID